MSKTTPAQRGVAAAAALIAAGAMLAPAASASTLSVNAPAAGSTHYGTGAESFQKKGWTEDAAPVKAGAKTGVAPAKSAYYASAAKVVIYYNDYSAPSYQSLIARSASTWNGALTRVAMSRTTGRGDITYYEGNYGSAGSTARWTSPGHGTIQIDYAQTNQYSAQRVVAHETGHVIGNLPDHYSGPCSELMSGGGAGPSCTVATPNSSERARADSNY